MEITLSSIHTKRTRTRRSHLRCPPLPASLPPPRWAPRWLFFLCHSALSAAALRSFLRRDLAPMVAPLHLPGSLTNNKLTNQLGGRRDILGLVLFPLLNFCLGSGARSSRMGIFLVIDKTLQRCGSKLVCVTTLCKTPPNPHTPVSGCFFFEGGETTNML